LDGVETAAQPATSTGNDVLNVVFAEGGTTSTGNMFAERGLLPQFSIFRALASNTDIGFLTAADDSGSQWVEAREGWEQFESIDVSISSDMSQVTITVVNSNSQTLRATVPTSDKTRVHLLGRDGGAVLVQVVAPSTQFTFTPVAGAVAAVDAVFAQDL
jgi:hypothetical protein